MSNAETVAFLEDMQLSAGDPDIDAENKNQKEQIAKATIEVLAVPASVPDHVLHETIVTGNNSGSSSQTDFHSQEKLVARGQVREARSSGRATFKAPDYSLSTISGSRRLEYIFAILAALIPIMACILMVRLRYLSGPLIQGIDDPAGWVQGWIDTCRTQAVQDNPYPGNPGTANQAFNLTGSGIDEKTMCNTFLRCVISQATGDYQTFWSSAASILAFIPTIVGMLSNSIEEIVAIADESPGLALLLALSSTTSFSSRFANAEAPDMFEQYDGYILAAKKSIVHLVSKRVRQNERSRGERWVKNQTLHMAVAMTSLIVCSGGIWYSVWTLTRYGCVVWSCPTKLHTSLWVALCQVLAVLNIALRSSVFRTEQLTLRIPKNTGAGNPKMSKPLLYGPGHGRSPTLERWETLTPVVAGDITIVLRCRRQSWKRWFIQTTSSVISFALYTLSTVVLASMVLILPVNAIYIMVSFSVAGGVGRLVGYWARSPLRLGNGVIVFDVPAIHMKALKEELQNEVDWQNLGTDDGKHNDDDDNH